MPLIKYLKINALCFFVSSVFRGAEAIFPSKVLLGFLLFVSSHYSEADALLDTQPILSSLQNVIAQELAHWQKKPGWEDAEIQYAGWVADGAKGLPACQQPLTTDLATRDRQPWGSYQYRISCAQPNWSFRARIDVAIQLPVWTVTEPLIRMHVLTSQDLVLTRVALDKVRSSFSTSADHWVGYRLIRNVQPGDLITESLLKPPLLISKGDVVTIRVATDGVTASTEGEALEEGVLGQQIRVKNQSSQKVNHALVSAPHEVVVHY